MKRVLFIVMGLWACNESEKFGSTDTFLKTFGNKGGTSVRTVRELPQGGYCIVGADFLEPYTVVNDDDPNFQRIQAAPILFTFDEFGNEKLRRTYHIELGTLNCHQQLLNSSLGIDIDSSLFQFTLSEFRDVVPLPDGGFFIIGFHIGVASLDQPNFSFNLPPFGFVPFIVIVDEAGTINRYIQFDCSNEYRVYLSAIDLGGSIAVRSSRSDFFDAPDGNGYSVAAFDYEGNLQWERDYDRDLANQGGRSFASEFISNGGQEFYITGTLIAPQKLKQTFIRAIDRQSGEIVNEIRIGSEDNNHVSFSITHVNDNQLALAQVLYQNGDTDADAVTVTILNKELSILDNFQATEQEVAANENIRLIHTADDHLLLQATLFDAIGGFDVFNEAGFNFDIFLWKLDLEGNLVWKIPDPSNIPAIPRNLIAKEDDSVVGLRFGQIGTGGGRGILMKFNRNGELGN